jgi:hypothetical protein
MLKFIRVHFSAVHLSRLNTMAEKTNGHLSERNDSGLIGALSALQLISPGPNEKTILVLVGPDPPIPFTLDEELICASSTSFKTALNSGFKESSQRTVHLDEDDPTIFQIYSYWLKGHVTTGTGLGWDTAKNPSSSLAKLNAYVELAKAYVLADKLQDVDFADTVMDAVALRIHTTNEVPGPETVRHVYENTFDDSSPARRWLVDVWAREGRSFWLYPADKEELPYPFLRHLTVAFLGLRDRVGATRDGSCVEGLWTCKCHVHEKEPGWCYKNKLKGGLADTATATSAEYKTLGLPGSGRRLVTDDRIYRDLAEWDFAELASAASIMDW